jgi:hypothetical protein
MLYFTCYLFIFLTNGEKQSQQYSYFRLLDGGSGRPVVLHLCGSRLERGAQNARGAGAPPGQEQIHLVAHNRQRLLLAGAQLNQ